MMTAMAMTPMTNTGQTAWVKWLTLKEMAVMPSGLASDAAEHFLDLRDDLDLGDDEGADQHRR